MPWPRPVHAGPSLPQLRQRCLFVLQDSDAGGSRRQPDNPGGGGADGEYVSPPLAPSGCLTRCQASGGTAALMRSCRCSWTDRWTDGGCTGPCRAPPAPQDLCTPSLAGSSSPGLLSGRYGAGTGFRRTGPAVSTAGSAAGAGSSDPAPATSLRLHPSSADAAGTWTHPPEGRRRTLWLLVSSSCASAAAHGLKATSVSTAGFGTELLPRAEPRERAMNLHTSGWLQHGCHFCAFSKNKAGSQAKNKSHFKWAWCT